VAEQGKKKRKTKPTAELIQLVLGKLSRMDKRLVSIETQQVLTQQAVVRQGKVVEEVNRRCMERLGLECPLVEDGEDQNGD
jgi:hypothetical protein